MLGLNLFNIHPGSSCGDISRKVYLLKTFEFKLKKILFIINQFKDLFILLSLTKYTFCKEKNVSNI